jgi:GTP pyrophosphokinase
LGIDWIKRELEDLSFMHLYPDEFIELAREVDERVTKRQAYVEEVKGIISKKLAENGLSCRVLGRPKHLYSIFKKMHIKNVGLDEVYDLVAFRIILKTPQECYEALGIMHSMWKPISYRFKDFIALPKANMYQSLHTTVIGPYGERVEIQIRTEEMDKVASQGIAAHWLYKEGKVVSKDKQRGFDWLNRLMEWQKELEDPRQFLQSVKMDLFPDEVYVFTPRGDVKGFPKGATPIDFAYSIHTEVGHYCSGAKIHGRLVPLGYQLKNGDVVEIITSSQHVPSKDWLKLAKTSRALTRIRQWIHAQEREQGLALGKELCEREFKKERLDFNELFKERGEEIARSLSFKTTDDLMVAVGFGKISPLQVFHKATREERKEEITEVHEVPRHAKPTGKGIKIHDIDNVMIHLARCCTPIPGDNVLGYITRGKGVTVHKENCSNLASLEPERMVEIDWVSPDHETYPVRLRVEATDKQGLLAAISSAISASGSNIEKASVSTSREKKAVFDFKIDVSDRKHLRKIIAGIRKVDGVINVHRMLSG